MRAEPASAEDAPIPLRKRSADLITLHLAPLGHVTQREARLVYDLACGGLGCVERLRDLGVAQAAQLAHDQRAPLTVRQSVEVGDELTQPLARLGLRVRRRLRRLRQRGIDERGPAAQDRDRFVVGDAVEPWPERDPPLLVGQRSQGGLHRVLERVLRLVGIGQDGAAEAIELLVIAPEDRLERPLVAPARKAGQALVAEQPQRSPRR